MNVVAGVGGWLVASAAQGLIVGAAVWERPGEAIRQALGPAVHAFHRPIDAWLGSLPMSVAMSCAVGLFVITGLWVWTLRRDFIFRGAPSQRWWCDLRIWATLVLLPYIAMYIMLG